MIEYLTALWANSQPLDKLAFILFPFVLTAYLWFRHKNNQLIYKALKDKLNKRG